MSSSRSLPVIFPPDLLALIPAAYRGAAAIGDSPEEIARWKAERRRHFPTDAVIAAKRSRATEGAGRGEEPLAAPLGKMRRKSPSAAAVATAEADTGAGADTNLGQPGILDLSIPGVRSSSARKGENASDSGPDEEPTSATPAAASASAPAPTSASTADSRLGLVKPAAASAASGSGHPCRTFFSKGGHCRFGASCRFSHAAAPAASARAAPGSIAAVCRWYVLGVCGAGARCPYQHAGGAGGGRGGEAAGPVGLLRRLLTKDVQRETSMILQAIRFIKREGKLIE